MSNSINSENNGGSSALAAARNKLQTSAREIMRNIESALGSSSSNSKDPHEHEQESYHHHHEVVTDQQQQQSEGSLEQAFRMFFSSCTTGAAMSTNEVDQEIRAAQVTPVSTQPSEETESLSSSHNSRSRRRPSSSFPPPAATNRNLVAAKDSLRRFAAKNNSHNKTPSPLRASHLRHQQRQASPRTDFVVPSAGPHPSSRGGQHIYEQLLLEEEVPSHHHHQRTTNNYSIPLNRRQRSPQESLGISPNTQPYKKRPTTRPFPVSTPICEDVPQVADAFTPDTSFTPASQGIAIPESPTFDDGISAISAHTLEAMARDPAPSPSPSTWSPYKPSKVVSSSPLSLAQHHPPHHHNHPPHRGGGVTTPMRTRQHRASAIRYGTPQSRSTETTQSSSGKESFECWKHSEQQFWEKEVRGDEMKKENKDKRRYSSIGKRRPARNTTADATLSTNSWSNDKWLHPHETLVFERSDLTLSELQETGEI